MKNIFLLLFVCTSLIINAQTEKGSWMLSADTGLSLSNSTLKMTSDDYYADEMPEVSVNTYSVDAGVGYFIIDNLAVGLSLSFDDTQTEVDDASVSSGTLAFAPFATYYFQSSTKTRPYLGVSAGSMVQLTESADEYGDSTTVRNSGSVFGVSGGAAIFLNEIFSVNVGATFSSASMEDDTEYKTTSDISGFGVEVGLTIYL